MQGNETIAVIGLGYVGLPLAVAFGRHRRVIGFDVNAGRIAELQAGHDSTLEVEPEELARVSMEYTTDPERLRQATVYIVTVPTPIDGARRPDLTPLLRASETIGTVLKPGDLVIYESTVYPGATEEVCVPVLERVSRLGYITTVRPALAQVQGDRSVSPETGSITKTRLTRCAHVIAARRWAGVGSSGFAVLACRPPLPRFPGVTRARYMLFGANTPRQIHRE